MKHLCATLILALSASMAGVQQAGAQSSALVKAIVGANVVKVQGGATVPNAVVVIEGDQIKSIGPAGSAVPAGAEVIQANGMWLLPGLMNMHVHMGMDWDENKESLTALTLRKLANARKILDAGVTTIRSPGSDGDTEVTLRSAFARGDYLGPRIFTAGKIPITGGHGGHGPNGPTDFDGPYEVTKVTRAFIRDGQDWIKIFISGGIGTVGGGISEALMTPEEIKAVIDAAHRFGAKVTAHSGSTVATNTAVDAGVDCIEHGYVLDREVLKKMAKQGTWLVPTLMVTHRGGEEYFERNKSPPWFMARRAAVAKQHWTSFKTAIEEGVNIALGTDQYPWEPNDGTTSTVRELEAYVEAGMTPLQALRTATVAPAKMLGIDGEVGVLEEGKMADIIAVSADPTKNISAMRNITFVMKSGKVHRNTIGEANKT